MILFPAKRKLRKLAKSLIKTHLQYLPWETTRVWERIDYGGNTTGVVRSSEIVVNGLTLQVRLRYDTGWIEVYVYADGSDKYPGGMYTVHWLGNPWRWEWRLWNKVYHDEKGTKVTPTFSARDDLIQNPSQGTSPKTPAALSTLGQLSLVKSSEEMTIQEAETQV